VKTLKLALAGACLALSFAAMAQTYPNRPITLLFNAPGGAPEGLQRAIAEKIHENTGAVFVMESRPGGGGAVGLLAAKKAPADGYTFAITYASAINLNPLINKELGFDPVKDFVPVTNLFALGVVLAARGDGPITDIRDLVARAKAKPGTVSVGIFGAGNKSWMAMLEEATGAKFLQVPYKSTSELVQATLGGHIDAHFETVGTVVANGGKLRALSFGGTKASPQLPNVPVVRDLYKFDMLSWFAIVAPTGTPQSAVEWLSREAARAIRDPKVSQLIESSGFIPVGNTPDEFAKALRAELEQNAEIVRKYPDIK
jgi:tripartite-type tricarboxylate transporter receptor subunit TctC